MNVPRGRTVARGSQDHISMSSQDGRDEGRVPQYKRFFGPIIELLQTHGGSATNSEIETGIIEAFNLPDDILEERVASGVPRLRNRLAWAKVDLTKAGYIESRGRGVWAITSRGQIRDVTDTDEILREARQAIQKEKQAREKEPTAQLDVEEDDETPTDSTWKAELLQILLAIDPYEFERLCLRMLREAGFSEIVVTQKAGDGGIDGFGTLHLQGLISIPIAIQCKRYQGTVGSPEVQRFRGSLAGQADRGLLITTGTFTQGALREAKREGAIRIDVMDGDSLMDKIRELGLGVNVETVEQTTVDTSWWESNYGVSLSDTLDEEEE